MLWDTDTSDEIDDKYIAPKHIIFNIMEKLVVKCNIDPNPLNTQYELPLEDIMLWR